MLFSSQAVLSSFATEGRNVEVVFSFDTTGSMASYLGKVDAFFQRKSKPTDLY